jgi:hypothetical protein
MVGPGLLPFWPSGPALAVTSAGILLQMRSADGWLRPVQKFTERSLQTAATGRTVIVLGAPNGGSDTQAGRTPRNPARRPGWIGSLAPAMLSLWAVLSLRLGEAAGELTDVVSADQLAHDGVAGWRHCPVIAGCAAAPDSPPRVLAPEPLKFGILVVPAWPGVHGGRREVVGRPRCCGRRAGAWMAAGAMQLPPSRWDLRRRRARSPAPESGGPARAARPVIPLTTWAVGYGADRHSGRSGSLIACPRSGHCADAFG